MGQQFHGSLVRSITYPDKVETGLIYVSADISGYADVTWTKLLFDSVDVNNLNMFDSANSRVPILTAGKYRVSVKSDQSISSPGSASQSQLEVYKTGVAESASLSTSNQAATSGLAYDVECKAGDYLEIYVYFNIHTGNTPKVLGGIAVTNLRIEKL